MSYVPELAGTPFGTAKVQHLLDMAVTLQFNQEYANPDSELQTEDRCTGWRARRAGDPENSHAFLAQLKGDNGNAETFQYCSATTDVLSWVLERAARLPYVQLASDLIWSRMGTEADAFFTVDTAGTAYACAGMGMTLADLARFGRLVRDGGSHLGQQIIPASWIKDTRNGGSLPVPNHRYFGLQKESGSYRNQWWITDDDHGSFYGIGINQRPPHEAKNICLRFVQSHQR
jgi:CubicO group peptidase (beta-lactamase class C family)